MNDRYYVEQEINQLINQSETLSIRLHNELVLKSNEEKQVNTQRRIKFQ